MAQTHHAGRLGSLLLVVLMVPVGARAQALSKDEHTRTVLCQGVEVASATSTIAPPAAEALCRGRVAGEPDVAWSLDGLQPGVNAIQRLAREASERGASERAQINWNAQTRGSGDSVLNGTLIGMAVGAAAGLVGSAAIYRCNDEPECAPVVTVFTLVGAGVGAVAGLAIDASKSQHRVVLSPVLRKDRQGMALLVRF
jgi:hypothetical protein